jgi:tryptophan synthase alpha chain
MGRIGDLFASLRARGERALIPFLTAGDPDLETTEALVRATAEAGADVIELGVPFSDPIADGPTIQRASDRALRAGVSLRRILELVKRLRADVECPLVLFGYANPYLAMGERNFAEAASEVGVDGVICPDLPPEEGATFYAALAECGIDAVLLAAPTTRDARLARLAQETRGFLYYVSLTGVTRARSKLATDIARGVERIRAVSEVPVCVGFGVSTPEHTRAIGAFADGVVVGSAIVDRVEAANSGAEAVEAVATFVSELKAPLRPASRG